MLEICHYFYEVLQIPLLNHVEMQVNRSKVSLGLQEIKIKKLQGKYNKFLHHSLNSFGEKFIKNV